MSLFAFVHMSVFVCICGCVWMCACMTVSLCLNILQLSLMHKFFCNVFMPPMSACIYMDAVYILTGKYIIRNVIYLYTLYAYRLSL